MSTTKKELQCIVCNKLLGTYTGETQPKMLCVDCAKIQPKIPVKPLF